MKKQKFEIFGREVVSLVEYREAMNVLLLSKDLMVSLCSRTENPVFIVSSLVPKCFYWKYKSSSSIIAVFRTFGFDTTFQVFCFAKASI